MNLRIITKNHAADPEIGFLTKSISKLHGRATAMPTAWELISLFKTISLSINYSWFVTVADLTRALLKPAHIRD